jgi:serine/threonine-protein kinase
MASATGDILLGKYQILSELGRGGMGIVYRAINIATEGEVALKVLAPSHQRRDDSSQRMFREARAAARLRSRFITRVFDFDQTADGRPVLVMEFLEGHDLGAEIRRSKRLEVATAIAYVVQACAGIGEAHALGMVHRDLKPANLFVDTTSASSPMVRVLDFGLAKLMSGTHLPLTCPKVAVGTLTYMSPEQIRGSSTVDARTDVWALGLILYRALTGELPYRERGVDVVPRILDPAPIPIPESAAIPGELARVLSRALSKPTAGRFPDARAFGNALRPFITRPSPMTTLALEELATPVVPRPSFAELLARASRASLSTEVESGTETVSRSAWRWPDRRSSLVVGALSLAVATGALMWSASIGHASPPPSLPAPLIAMAVDPLPAPAMIPEAAPVPIAIAPKPHVRVRTKPDVLPRYRR